MDKATFENKLNAEVDSKKQKTLDWLLNYVKQNPGCSAEDVPANRRQFRTLEQQGKITYGRDGGWYAA